LGRAAHHDRPASRDRSTRYIQKGKTDMDRFAVANALREMGRLLEARGESPFRVRAYERGARAVEGVADLGRLVDEDRLREVPGIGPVLASAIAELHTTGRSERLEKLRAQMPPGILELGLVPGMTRQRIAALHQALGVRGLDDLKAAAEAGRVRTVKGFGPRTEEKILEGIRGLATREERVLLHHAEREAEGLLRHLKGAPQVARADVAGALRRREETVTEISLVAASRDPAKTIRHFSSYPMLATVLERGPGHCAARLPDGLRVELTVAPPAAYATALHRLTGSRSHLQKLDAVAQTKGLTLTDARDEADLYLRLGLPPLPPEVREDEGEVEAAAAGDDFADLVTDEDVRGLVHCHTVYSDGKHTVEQMARAAEAMGMQYITITDHSPTAHYAGGLPLDRLKRQWDEIAKAQEKVKVRLLRGTESDILADGALDYPDAVLEQLDIVIASVHNRHKMSSEQMTRRLVAAMRQPVFKVWGHAQGRYVLTRPPFECDMDAVLDAVAQSRAAVEVNGDPHRLDMVPRWLREARKRGIRFVISTDAHSTAALQNVRYGVAMARRGWVRRGEVLNALPVDAFRRAVRPGAAA
jgi:DNA polymerase (family 10)